VKKDTQANKAYHEIRRNILTTQLHPNTRLKEDHWSKKLNVSRMAVREALTRLLGEGLVTSGEKGGYFVTEMTEEDVLQIREAREVLEIAALELAIKRLDDSKIAKLESICDDFSVMVKKGYLSGANEVDLRFHEKLVELSGNRKLLNAYHYCHIPIFHRKLGHSHLTLDDYDQTDAEHREILKALKNKKIETAKEMLIKHFRRGESAILT
jgi:DNA-binding GntR family transcriptional regulator